MKKYFFLKLNPPRTSFMNDMNAEEKEIMQKHVLYWKPYVNDGTMLVMGPVFDPKGGYGVGIIAVDSDEQLEILLKKDPANGLNTYEVYPMRVAQKQ